MYLANTKSKFIKYQAHYSTRKPQNIFECHFGPNIQNSSLSLVYCIDNIRVLWLLRVRTWIVIIAMNHKGKTHKKFSYKLLSMWIWKKSRKFQIVIWLVAKPIKRLGNRDQTTWPWNESDIIFFTWHTVLMLSRY